MQEKNVITNKYWSDNERFADIINVGMFQAKKVLSAEELEENDSTLYAMVGKEKKKVGMQKHRDVVKKAAFHTNFAIVGIENQTDIHYAMPVKIMGYDYMDYDKQWQEIRKEHREKKDLTNAEFLSGFSKEDKLSPVCTLVLYYGEEPWDGPTRLSEMMDFENLPEEIREVVADYPIHVIDMRRFKDSEKLETDARLLFGVMQREGNLEEWEAYQLENEEEFSDLSEEAYEAIAVLTKSKELLNVRKNKTEEEGGVDMCEALEQMMLRERIRTRIQDIFEILNELGSIPEELESKISAETDMEVLSRWHKLAAKSDTIETFIEKM